MNFGDKLAHRLTHDLLGWTIASSIALLGLGVWLAYHYFETRRYKLNTETNLLPIYKSAPTDIKLVEIESADIRPVDDLPLPDVGQTMIK